jgi:hypothetical protein
VSISIKHTPNKPSITGHDLHYILLVSASHCSVDGDYSILKLKSCQHVPQAAICNPCFYLHFKIGSHTFNNDKHLGFSDIAGKGCRGKEAEGSDGEASSTIMAFLSSVSGQR